MPSPLIRIFHLTADQQTQTITVAPSPASTGPALLDVGRRS